MENQRIPNAGDFYLNFKNKLFQIRMLAIDAETKETVVIYQALYGDFTLYSRPLRTFLSKVEKDKFPEATQEERYRYLSPEELLSWQASKKESNDACTTKDGKSDIAATIQEDSRIKSEVKDEGTIKDSSYEKPHEPRKTYRFIDAAPTTLTDFLDADTDIRRLEILHQMRTYIDDFTIDSIAVSLDYVPNGNSIEERYYSVCKYLEMKINYESKRK